MKKEISSSLSKEEKEDLGLLELMQKVDRSYTINKIEVMAVLKKIK